MNDVLTTEATEASEDVNISETNTETLASESEEKITDESTDAVDEENNEQQVEDTTDKNEEETSDNVGDTIVKNLSTRAQKRFQKIMDQKKALEERLRNVQQQAIPNSFEPNEEGEVELTPDQLQQMVSGQVQKTLHEERQAQLEAERAEAWDEDISELMKSNPELDPNSPKFNQGLSDALVELIKTTNVDSNGNPVVNKLPSEIYATINKTLSAAKIDGKKEASQALRKASGESAVKATSSSSSEAGKFSDVEIEKISQTDPRRYAELIEKGLI